MKYKGESYTNYSGITGPIFNALLSNAVCTIAKGKLYIIIYKSVIISIYKYAVAICIIFYALMQSHTKMICPKINNFTKTSKYVH